MSRASFAVKAVKDADSLVALLTSFGPNNALCSSVPSNGKESGEVVTRAALASNPGSIARTKDAFIFSAGPGVVIVDYDPPKGCAALSQDELWRAVLAAAPGLAVGAVVWWPSGSSCLWNSATGAELAPLKGQRLYALVQDARDTKRTLEVLSARLWLAGHGRVEVSESGHLLVRGLVDLAMTQTGRVDFAPAGAICFAPVEQRRGPPVVLAGGGFIDSRAVFPDLTPEESGRHAAMVSEAKAACRVESATAKAAWKAKHISENLPTLMKAGVSPADGEARISRAIDAAFEGTLLGDFILTVVHDDGRREHVSVDHVLSHRDEFHEKDCLCPLNPEHRGESPDARLYLQSASPVLFNLDDGGGIYHLCRQLARLVFARGLRGDFVDSLLCAVRTWPDVFSGPAGPVQIADGRCLPLTSNRLLLLVGKRCSIYQQGKGGDALSDLNREVCDLALTALN
jgi:hypothetical protein